MSEDREVLREVWQGRVPACFNLSSEDVHTMAIPEPYYLMLPRLSYIMIVTDKVSFLMINESSRYSSMVTMEACYQRGPGFKSRQGRE